jgi:hypothetical protein
MKRRQGKITAWTLAGILCCAPLAGGCDPLNWFGPNLTVDVIVPLGMGGSPGLFNPFGIVQAIVNGMLGVSSTGSTDSSAYATPDATASTAAQPYNPVIGAVLP